VVGWWSTIGGARYLVGDDSVVLDRMLGWYGVKVPELDGC